MSAVPVLTERAGGNVALADRFLVSSFIFSIVTIPLSMWCFSCFYGQERDPEPVCRILL